MTDGAGTAGRVRGDRAAGPGELELTVLARRAEPPPEPRIVGRAGDPQGRPRRAGRRDHDRGRRRRRRAVGGRAVRGAVARRPRRAGRWPAGGRPRGRRPSSHAGPGSPRSPARPRPPDVARLVAAAALAILLDPDAAGRRWRSLPAALRRGDIVLIVGPEGGVSPAEASPADRRGRGAAPGWARRCCAPRRRARSPRRCCSAPAAAGPERLRQRAGLPESGRRGSPARSAHGPSARRPTCRGGRRAGAAEPDTGPTT